MEETDDGHAARLCDVAVRFGDTVALDGFDLDIGTGEIHALLGPNGSGKTTAVRVLATLQDIDAGHAEVFGHDVRADQRFVRRSIALTGQYAAVDELLTGRQNLVMFGRLFGLSRSAARRRADELLERFDLADAADRKVTGYSGGMSRRLDLASSLLTEPRLLFLDEPTTGLDPRSRATIWQVVRELSESGATIVLTTQYLGEADALADRITVMDHGVAVATGNPGQLKAQAGGLVIELEVDDGTDESTIEEVLAATTSEEIERRGADRWAVAAGDEPVAALSEVADALVSCGVAVRTLALRGPDLDDVFLQLTGDRSGR